MIPLGDWSKQPLATEPRPFHPSGYLAGCQVTGRADGTTDYLTGSEVPFAPTKWPLWSGFAPSMV